MHYAAERPIAALLMLAALAATSISQAQTPPNIVEVQFQGIFDEDTSFGLIGGDLSYSGTIEYDANALAKSTSGSQSAYDIVSFTVVVAGGSTVLTSDASTSGLLITDSVSLASDDISFVSDTQAGTAYLGAYPIEEVQVHLGSSGPNTAFSGTGAGNVATDYNAGLNDQIFTFQFVVDGLPVVLTDADEIGSGGTDVSFVVSNSNQPPTANAGPDQSGQPGVTITLDGSGSTDDSTLPESLAYQWQVVMAPAGSIATLSDPFSPVTDFVIDVRGTYVAELVVIDGDGAPSTADDVMFGTDNLAPTSDAGSDQVVEIGSTANLDGSSSVDPENDAIMHEWTIMERPAGSTAELVGADTATPTFTPDLAGEYVVSLSASDSIGPGAPDSVVITATNPPTGSTSVAIAQLAAASELIAGLPPESFRRGGTYIGELYRRSALFALRIAASRLSRYETTGQRRLLVIANYFVRRLLRQVDGCARNGTPDRRGRGRDTIVDCDAQAEINAILQPVAATLQELLRQ